MGGQRKGQPRQTMRLGELLDDPIALGTLAKRAVTGLTADSRAVEPGYVFAALVGAQVDGRKFIQKAIENGALAILTDRVTGGSPIPADVAVILDREPRRRLALMAARFHKSQPEIMVGVTGTAGKTSVATFVRQLWMAAGNMAASIGTVGVVVGEETRYGNLTTPDPVSLHRILAELAADGVTRGAMEASSHGLHQNRLDGVRLMAAGFTNLGRDHLDYHPTMEDYLAAKLRLFDVLLPEGGAAVYNADCPEAQAIEAIADRRGHRRIGVGEMGTGLTLSNVQMDGMRQRLTIGGAFGEHDVLLPLAGRFQASNALVAAGLVIGSGGDAATTLASLATLRGAQGRLEIVGRTGTGADVIVDYAHKPDALGVVLDAVRPFASGRIIVVFGAGGDRDPGKRPLMGAIAVGKADRVIVTDDNPRTEDPASVRKAILEAAPGAVEIGDRAEAIAHALADAGSGDVVIVAGKGHEPGQIVGTEVLPFSDHAVIRDLIGSEG
ncbi:MAG: UDP-N-acetylmuramoyl-L-alanyl-D-glutamate--2,6-diaminopimelate ligase [Pseudomonadota bacterium]